MTELGSGLFLLNSLQGANVYLLASSTSLTVVDSGLVSDGERIRAQIRELGFSSSDLKNILLTHGHADHAGGAADLAERTGARVTAHHRDVPYLEKTGKLPYRSPLQRLMFWLSDRLLLKRSKTNVDRAVEGGEVINFAGKLEVIHTPGHTPGSISYYLPDRRILFCGDALFNAHPLTGKSGLRLPLPLVSVDNDLAYQSVVRLAELKVEMLCPGHGKPLLQNTGAAIQALLKEGQ